MCCFLGHVESYIRCAFTQSNQKNSLASQRLGKIVFSRVNDLALKLGVLEVFGDLWLLMESRTHDYMIVNGRLFFLSWAVCNHDIPSFIISFFYQVNNVSKVEMLFQFKVASKSRKIILVFSEGPKSSRKILDPTRKWRIGREEVRTCQEPVFICVGKNSTNFFAFVISLNFQSVI